MWYYSKDDTLEVGNGSIGHTYHLGDWMSRLEMCI